MKSTTQPAYYFSANPLKAVKDPKTENHKEEADLPQHTQPKNNGTLSATESSLKRKNYTVIPKQEIIEDIEKLHPDWYNNYE